MRHLPDLVLNQIFSGLCWKERIRLETTSRSWMQLLRYGGLRRRTCTHQSIALKVHYFDEADDSIDDEQTVVLEQLASGAPRVNVWLNQNQPHTLRKLINILQQIPFTSVEFNRSGSDLWTIDYVVRYTHATLHTLKFVCEQISLNRDDWIMILTSAPNIRNIELYSCTFHDGTTPDDLTEGLCATNPAVHSLMIVQCHPNFSDRTLQMLTETADLSQLDKLVLNGSRSLTQSVWHEFVDKILKSRPTFIMNDIGLDSAAKLTNISNLMPTIINLHNTNIDSVTFTNRFRTPLQAVDGCGRDVDDINASWLNWSKECRLNTIEPKDPQPNNSYQRQIKFTMLNFGST